MTSVKTIVMNEIEFSVGDSINFAPKNNLNSVGHATIKKIWYDCQFKEYLMIVIEGNQAEREICFSRCNVVNITNIKNAEEKFGLTINYHAGDKLQLTVDGRTFDAFVDSYYCGTITVYENCFKCQYEQGKYTIMKKYDNDDSNDFFLMAGRCKNEIVGFEKLCNGISREQFKKTIAENREMIADFHDMRNLYLVQGNLNNQPLYKGKIERLQKLVIEKRRKFEQELEHAYEPKYW